MLAFDQDTKVLQYVKTSGMPLASRGGGGSGNKIALNRSQVLNLAILNKILIDKQNGRLCQ